ncbi:MAG: hypothetical protein WAM59_10985 [Candidatus Acidiferrales bacterium]
MKPGHKLLILALALIVPYVAVMIFIISKYPPNNVPEWISLSGGCYILVTILLAAFLGNRIIGRGKTGMQPTASSRRLVTIGMLFIAYLVVLWSCFFVYGAFELFKGEIPAGRALPAGALLLALILVVGWSLWRYLKLRRANNNVSKAKKA